MKQILVHFLLLTLVVIWPTGMVVSGPPRSWDRMGGEIDLGKWQNPDKKSDALKDGSIAAEQDPQLVEQQMAKVGELKNRLETDRKRLTQDQATTEKKAQIAKVDEKKAVDKKPAKSAQVDDEQSLKSLKEENSSDDVVKIEWVGKGRRLQRIKKSKGGEGSLQLYKPPNKLIVTDRYHKTIPELLNTTELRRYGARPAESSWNATGSKFLCEIRHPIPGFGQAVFKRGIGQRMQFAIESYTTTGGTGPARVQSVPPVWKHYASVRDLGMVPVKPSGNTLFTVSSDWAGRLMLELEEGMEPTFAFWDEQTGAEDILVKISSFNFKQSLPEFNRCMGDMLPYSYQDVRQSTIFFGYDKSTVGQVSHARLKKIVEYVNLDKTIKYVDVIGYSDSRGFKRYNQLLAKKRASAVKKFLVAQGLDKNRIRVKARGEKGKKHSNRTETGRRKNRRVEVTLLRN